MVCESWTAKLDMYLDGELSQAEMRTVDRHVRSCHSCSVNTVARVQMKRTIQLAGRRFTPSTQFRRRLREAIAPKPQGNLGRIWMFAAAAAFILAIASLTSTYMETRRDAGRVFSEIADLHVATLASSSPVDVISTDRHTVKPWFQGKIPFAFNLPELRNSDFSLLGGRMTYLDQTPGAHLIYDVRKHHISVFVFQERSLPAKLDESFLSQKKLPFNMETWTQGGLRYFIIGDASAADMDNLVQLLKAAS